MCLVFLFFFQTPGDGMVTGQGEINGRPVFVYCQVMPVLLYALNVLHVTLVDWGSGVVNSVRGLTCAVILGVLYVGVVFPWFILRQFLFPYGNTGFGALMDNVFFLFGVRTSLFVVGRWVWPTHRRSWRWGLDFVGRMRSEERERERERERKEFSSSHSRIYPGTERAAHCGKGTHRSYNAELQFGQSVG